MKNQILITFILLIIFSCKEDVPEPSPYDVVQPQISQLSPDFLFTGDTLTITGSNFIDSNFGTKIFIDDVEYNVNSISNNEIQIEITTPMGLEQKHLKIKIGERSSSDKEFFIMPKQTWHPIISEGSKYYKVKIFPDTNDIYYLESESEDPMFSDLYKLHSTKKGLKSDYFFYPRSCVNFAKYKEDSFFLLTIVSGVRYTTNNFEDFTSISDYWVIYTVNLSDEHNIIDYNENMCIVHNGVGVFRRYNFSSNTFEEYRYETYNNNNSNLGPYRLFNIVKDSDGFYGVGRYINSSSNTSEMTFLAMKSPNGFDDWSVIHQTAPYKNLSKALFVDSNLLYIIEDNKLMKSVDLGLNWELVEDNVSAIFMKNDTEWYKVSNDKLYYSSNAMASWEFELDLPVGAEALSMDFTENKKIISGDGYMYIYYN